MLLFRLQSNFRELERIFNLKLCCFKDTPPQTHSNFHLLKFSQKHSLPTLQFMAWKNNVVSSDMESYEYVALHVSALSIAGQFKPKT